MLRRSSSTSHIPLPSKNLFGSKESTVSKTLKRSQSTSRVSYKDGGFQFRPQRKSSLDRKSSTTGLLRVTPLHGSGARSRSLQRTTPSSVISQRTASSQGTTPSSCRKDRVTIQKLSTDKRWVSEQFVKVQNFIMSSDLFDLAVVTSADIKPPSINNFIYITGILLMEIFPRAKINKENYKEVIPAQLKVLRYPGTLTVSVLKTVNTMHSWPQVIGMWSWLIDKVMLYKNFNDPANMNHLEPEERTKILLKQNALEFLIKRYMVFNNTEDCPDETEKINVEYEENLAQLLDVDFDKLKQLQEDVSKNKEYRNKQEREIEHLKVENKRMESEIEEMKKEIEDFQENDPIEDKELENEVESLQLNVRDQQGAIDSTKTNIGVLQDAIKAQPCTFQQKKVLTQQIEELKKEIEVKRQKIEHAREIKHKFDHKLTTDISTIQSLVIGWNRALMEVSIKKPYLKKLLLREKGFHDPNFLEELQGVSSYKISVERDVVEALTTVESDLKVQERKKHDLEDEVRECDENIRQSNEDYEAVMEEITEIMNEIKKMVKDLEEKTLCHAQNVKEFQENDELVAQKQVITDLVKEKQGLEVEVKNFGPKMLSFFVEMHNQVIANLKEMEGIKAKLIKKIEDKQNSVVEKQREIVGILKSFGD